MNDLQCKSFQSNYDFEVAFKETVDTTLKKHAPSKKVHSG